MNTKQLKPFTQKARNILLDGVRTRMFFWGFDEKLGIIEEPEQIPGGVIFREEIYNDTTLFSKWGKLKKQVANHTYKDVVEEAAYTWFNRLMAVKILEKNGFESPLLQYRGEADVPALLDNARNGIMPFLNNEEKQKVREHILNGNEEAAFGILLVGFCRKHPLLNRVFGGIDDFTELLLPNNLLSRDGIVELINRNGFVAEEDYKQVELIGWLYQFYISDRKDEVFKGFKSNKKARKEDIPAATQIFTPKWIVKYMVENTVGRVWLDHQPDSGIREEMKYLVESHNEAADEIIQEVKQLSLLDPAVGSGHILVTAFDLYIPMYKEVGYTTRLAVREIIKNNLFGLDIDKRAAQLARFAVLMKAASYDPDILREEMVPNIYSMPEPYFFDRNDINEFLIPDLDNASNTIPKEEKANQLADALRLMLQAQNLGSIMIFDLPDETRQSIATCYDYWKKGSHEGTLNIAQQGWWNNLQPYLEPLLLLTTQYPCVVANPPYMGQKNMNSELKEYINKNFLDSKTDFYSVFMELMINKVKSDGLMACITMEGWMFISSFESLRDKILRNYTIISLAHFGWHVLGIAFGTATFIIQKSKKNILSEFSYLSIDDINQESNEPNVFPVKNNNLYSVLYQTLFNEIPSTRIGYWIKEGFLKIFKQKQLSELYEPKSGVLTGKDNLFVRNWYEVNYLKINFKLKSYENMLANNPKWIPITNGGPFKKWYGNLNNIVNMENNGNDIKNLKENNFRLRNPKYYFREGINWTLFSSSDFCVRYSPQTTLFGNGSRTFFPKKEHLNYLLALFNTKIVQFVLKLYNPTNNSVNEDIASVPVIFEKRDRIDYLADQCIYISKQDWDERENSWNFQKSPLLNNSPSIEFSLNNWLKKASKDFFQLHSNEQELNKIFIDIYGLQDELTPMVELKDITILKDELDYNKLKKLYPPYEGKLVPVKQDVVLQQFISYSFGCMMGRYRLDKPGLNIAHPEPTHEELSSYNFNNNIFQIDEDAIIPMMGSDSAFPDNIVNRFKNFVQVIWGEETLTQNLNFINSCLGMDLEKFLTEKFWDYHKKVYQKKPIYWLFSSPGGSFKVLTYMHRMDKYTVQKIRLNYLHRHIEFLTARLQEAEAGQANLREIDKLNKAIIDCKDYDKILKPLSDLQITFDLDDGVTVNYAKFSGAVAPLK